MAIDVFPQPVLYSKRPLPPVDEKDAAKGAKAMSDFLTRELGAVERSLAAVGRTPSRTVTADVTATESDGYFAVDATGGAVTVTLPSAVRYGGRIFYVKKTDASANVVTVVPAGTDTIDGSASLTLGAQYESVSLYALAGGWSVLSQANIIAPGGISGSGTAGTLPVFTGASAIGDSIIAQAGGTATVTGDLTVTTNLTVNGDTTIGNATSDTLTVTARLAADLDPSANNTVDLGASGLAYKDGWFAGTLTAATGTFTNLAATGTLTVGGIATLLNATQKRGTDATGTNAAATSVTTTGPLSTGNATPAALIWQVGVQGSSGSTLQTATEGFRVQEVANVSSRDIAAWNPGGRFVSRIPTTAATTLFPAIDGGTFGRRISVIDEAQNAIMRIGRFNGAWASPTAVGNGAGVGGFAFQAWDGSGFRDIALVDAFTREVISGSGNGGRLRLLAVDVGTTSVKAILQIRGGGTNIGEVTLDQATTRFIVGATQFALRDSGNTADTFTVNAAGTAIYAPIATAVGVGTSSNNAAAILQADSTTRGFLPPRMTTTQRDAISSPPAGLLIYNTTTNKLNVYTTAWEAITSA